MGEPRIIGSDRAVSVEMGDGAMMRLPLPSWLWNMNWVRPEPDHGTKCDDRMLAVSALESYLYLIQHCNKDEAWRRIKILRSAIKALGYKWNEQ